MNRSRQIKHLYARAGFGIPFEDLKHEQNWSLKKSVKSLFKRSAFSPPLNIIAEHIVYNPLKMADAAEKRELLRTRRQQENDLNTGWMLQMSETAGQLREKMTLFWHGHFACRMNDPFYLQQLNNIHRDNALGNFRQMVLKVSQAPAMLNFLNNQQNRKGHPNENFARELMELFTIGRGNYTEDDVKAAARSFTGWSYDKTGSFVFRAKQHDDGEKTFFGKTGDFQGEDIINMILERKETARFISQKLYQYLVNETPDPLHVNAMAEVFYKANYEIQPLLNFVFLAPWFYKEKNIGNLIKSPIALLAGLNRQFNIRYKNPDVLLQFQRTLGQVLFNPPNVAGWPGGKSWIDSSTLMYRLKITSLILNAGLIEFEGKADPEDEAYIAQIKKQQQQVNNRVQANVDWDKIAQVIPPEASATAISAFFMESEPGSHILENISASATLKNKIIHLVSTPEYQLC
ncbi:MAG: DUF1800 domain-containing protein [Sphingobacteriaceae bacterium]